MNLDVIFLILGFSCVFISGFVVNFGLENGDLLLGLGFFVFLISLLGLIELGVFGSVLEGNDFI